MKDFDPTSLIRRDLIGHQGYASAREEYEGNAGMCFLDANESPFNNGNNRYPDPQQKDLKGILAEEKQLSPSQIILGNGSDELLDLLFRCFCTPGGDNVISLPPTFGMYSVLAKLNSVQVREVPLDQEFQPRVKEVLGAIDAKTKLLFLCSPNNPTGNSLSEKRVRELIENFPGLVVLDEAYADFAGKSWLSSLKKYPNLVILQTFSKAYGLAGIRLGAGYASTEVIEMLQRVKMPYNVNVLTQQIATNRLKQLENVKKEIASILEQRSLLEAELDQLDYVRKIYPSNANFLLVKVDDAERRYRQFLEQGFVFRNRSGDLNCQNTLRITVGTAQENARLVEVARRIEKQTKIEI